MSVRDRFHFMTSYLAGIDRLEHFPLSLEIEVTNRCNEDCVMCPRSRLSRPFGYLSMSLLEKILEETAGRVELINLFHFGEPLLHRQLPEMVKLCKDRDMRVLVTTNGTLLTEQKGLQLIESGLDMLIISLDAARPDTYAAIRRIAAFDGVLSNVDAFLALKNKTGHGPYTQVQMVALKRNAADIPDFIRRWRGKADSVRVKHFHNTARIGPSIDEDVILPYRSNPCVLLWREPVILCDGTVVPCCVDMIGETPVGNVTGRSLMEIWNGPEMVALRRKHIAGSQHEIEMCRNCKGFHFAWPFVVGSVLFSDLTLRKLGTIVENLETTKRPIG